MRVRRNNMINVKFEKKKKKSILYFSIFTLKMFFGGFVVFKFLILNDILFMISKPLLIWESFLKARENVYLLLRHTAIK